MSTALTIYDKVENPISFMKELAKAAASLAGVNDTQGEVIAWVCLLEQMHPVDFVKKYHIIQGKPSMRADAMLVEFRRNHGGNYKLVTNTPDCCEIAFTDKAGEVYTRSLTKRDVLLSRWPWQSERDNKDAGWRKCTIRVLELFAAGQSVDQVWLTMQPLFKDNYGTPLDWQDMLFNRLVSSSMKKICPEVAAGIYTPEEVQDVLDNQPAVRVSDNRPTAAALMAEQERLAGQAEDTIDGELVDETEAPFAAAAEPGPNDNLAEAVRELFMDCFGDDAPAAIEDVLAKKQCGSLRSMSREQLVEIKDKLVAKKINAEASSGN